MAVLDSGARREFESGAVRDICEGKGRCDLLPLRECAEFLVRKYPDYIPLNTCTVLEKIQDARDDKDEQQFIDAAIIFAQNVFDGRQTALLEVAKHFEDGAVKYGDNNWQKGIPAHCYIDSGIRHYLKYTRGDKDERHDRAFLWNMLCLTWTLRNKPECNDIWDTAKMDEDGHGH